MIAKDCIVKNRYGLHIRPIAHFVEHAKEYFSAIFLEKDSVRANGKSIFECITLCLSCENKLTLIADGEDEEKAISDLLQVLSDENVEEINV